MKICFYAINGHGLGHLSRCYAIGKKLRSLLEMLSLEADIQFLTTSEADYIVRDFPVFKIPSRASFKGRNAAASRYSANGKMMVSNMLAHFSPDLLVMDTVAQGSFQELSFVKDFAKKKVLIDRHKKSHFNGDRIHKAHLPLFDKIMIPDELKNQADYQYDEAIQSKVNFVGKIHNFERNTVWNRDKVREFFNVGDRQKLIYISAGGGGDAEAVKQLSRVLEALKTLDAIVIIGYGALSSSEKIYGHQNVISLTECGVCKYFPGIDLAISAAGYNTYEELLAAEVNSLFFIQEKGMDQQERRVSIGLENRWHGVIDLNDSLDSIRSLIKKQLDDGPSLELSLRPDSFGAVVAAYEMVSCFISGKAEMKLEASMAYQALSYHACQKWAAENLVDSFRLWRLFVNELDGIDAWQQMCIGTLTKVDSKISDEWLSELNALTIVVKHLTELDLNYHQKCLSIKHLVREIRMNVIEREDARGVMDTIKTYLSDKNYVD